MFSGLFNIRCLLNKVSAVTIEQLTDSVCCAVNRTMSDGACRQFVRHAWKEDVCANCLRSRLKHADHVDVPVSPAPSQHSRSTSSPTAPSVHVGMNSSEVDAAKPSPVKMKPAVSAKPATPKKPNLLAEQVSAKSDIKQSNEHISRERLMPSKSKDSVPNSSSDFRSSEEELINSSDDVSDVVRSKEICVTNEKEVHSSEKTFHHYDLYDVTARELSGTPKQPEVVIEDESIRLSLDSESEHRKFRTLPASAMRADDVAEEHVAMPYNVVDITVRRPRVSDIDPPISDVASANSNSSSAGVSTWPSGPQPAKRQAIPRSPPKPRERASKYKEQVAVSLNTDASSFQDPDPGNCSKPSVVSRMMPSDIVSERYAHRIYEEIDDLDVEQSCSKADVELSRQTATRSSMGKSPAFEAKMAALASLDLGKTVQQIGTVSSTASLPEDSPAVKTTVASSVQDTVVVPAEKPEKTRKSGGKTFFQKLLKFGSKDTSEAVQSSIANRNDEGGMNVVECPDSPSSGRKNVMDDDTSSSSAVLTQTAQLTEKQAMLMNLKDCLAKRQTSIGIESSETFPVHSGTQSSEPTPLRSSTQPAGSVQPMQGYGSSMEKTEKQTIVTPALPVLETPPAADSQASDLAIQEQPSSKDVSISAPQHACKESDADRGLQSVDKKGNEVQRLKVKDLTVTTEDAGNVDGSVSTCSSDAVSPTPSDLSVDGTDHHSLKRKSRADRQGIHCIRTAACVLLYNNQYIETLMWLKYGYLRKLK